MQLYQILRDLVYKPNLVRDVTYKRHSDESDEYIKAPKYLFEVIEGTKEYNLNLINKSYSIIKYRREKYNKSDFQALIYQMMKAS